MIRSTDKDEESDAQSIKECKDPTQQERRAGCYFLKYFSSSFGHDKHAERAK